VIQYSLYDVTIYCASGVIRWLYIQALLTVRRLNLPEDEAEVPKHVTFNII
jgi:hypothetical protein